MGVLRIILTIIYVLVCIALTVIVLMQEGKSAGLGAISGAADTYWGQNKGFLPYYSLFFHWSFR